MSVIRLYSTWNHSYNSTETQVTTLLGFSHNTQPLHRHEDETKHTQIVQTAAIYVITRTNEVMLHTFHRCVNQQRNSNYWPIIRYWKLVKHILKNKTLKEKGSFPSTSKSNQKFHCWWDAPPTPKRQLSKLPFINKH